MANPSPRTDQLNHTLTAKEQSLGGIASGQVRKKNAIIRESLKRILNSGFKLPEEINDKDINDFVKKLDSIGIDTKQMQLVDLINCGQILGAIGGKADNYRTLLETSGELQESTFKEPHITSIEDVVENSHLEGIMYEEDKH